MQPKPTVYYHGRDNIDRIATLSIAGRIYDFHLTSQQLDTVEFLCRKVSALKAFNFAKRHAQRTTERT